MMEALPVDYTEEQRGISRGAEEPAHPHVDHTPADGEVLPYCGGLTVITTPGHTPGHLCLYHPPSKTLIAGDALALVDGRLQRPEPTMDLDRDAATRSLRKLARYDIATVICYHGGRYTGMSTYTSLDLCSESWRCHPEREKNIVCAGSHLPRDGYRFGRECPLWHSGGPSSAPMERPGNAIGHRRSPGNHPPAVPHSITGRNATAGIPYGKHGAVSSGWLPIW